MASSENNKIHELLVQYQHGNVEAGGLLYAYLAGPLYMQGRKKGLSHEDAKDIVSETFTRICDPHIINSYLEELRGGKAWVEKIFEHFVIDWQRRSLIPTTQPKGVNTQHSSTPQKRETSLEGFNTHDFISEEEDSNPEEYVLNKELKEYLMATWESLSVEDKVEIAVKGRGRGGRRGKPGRKAYREATERARKDFMERYS
jgi:DNA-directed RNA polymerase specialized sigma24 family protein